MLDEIQEQNVVELACVEREIGIVQVMPRYTRR